MLHAPCPYIDKFCYSIHSCICNTSGTMYLIDRAILMIIMSIANRSNYLDDYREHNNVIMYIIQCAYTACKWRYNLAALFQLAWPTTVHGFSRLQRPFSSFPVTKYKMSLRISHPLDPLVIEQAIQSPTWETLVA